MKEKIQEKVEANILKAIREYQLKNPEKIERAREFVDYIYLNLGMIVEEFLKRQGGMQFRVNVVDKVSHFELSIRYDGDVWFGESTYPIFSSSISKKCRKDERIKIFVETFDQLYHGWLGC